MTVELVYVPTLAQYRFNDTHPLRPERFTLAVELMRAWNLLDDAEPPSGARALVVEPAHRGASDACRGSVHVSEGGRVSVADAERAVPELRAEARLLDREDVVGAVHAQQVLVVDGRGFDHQSASG